LRIFQGSVDKIKLTLKSDKIKNGTLDEAQYTFVIIFHSFILKIRIVSDKNCTENQNTHFVPRIFFSFENRAVLS